MTGMVGILNVGAGDTKLVLDKDDPSSLVRGARIIKDMLRRGYALLAEIEIDGVKKFQRVREFREDTFEYVIADFDPVEAERADAEEKASEKASEPGAASPPPAQTRTPEKPRRGRPRTRTLDATKTRAHAVAHTSGG